MKIAFAYPGQGAQKIGMAKGFVDAYDWAKEMIKEASDASGIDMEKLLFEENENINITEYTQPALVTACMIMTKALTDEGITPDITGGLSLGEYCALVASGAMTYGDAVKLTRIRGSLMSNTVPAGEGTMAAIVGLGSDVIESVIKDIDGCTMANYNCPGQIVITGKTEAVEKAMPLLSEAGARKVVALKVSGPFHSPMLKPAGDNLRKYLDETEISELKVPYVANCNAELISDSSVIRDLLQKQVSSPVMWEQSLRVMAEQGVELIIEIGPGKTIAGFVKKTIPEIPVINVSSVEDIAKVKEALNG
ncbi:MAG: ACP S-malonyltransferase [Clostridiales bacterium]|nr:ACP S-malonyltransferase [Clostridiales bacterium]